MKAAANTQTSRKLSPPFIPSLHTPILLNPKNGKNTYQSMYIHSRQIIPGDHTFPFVKIFLISHY
jgi:hypothetical protein